MNKTTVELQNTFNEIVKKIGGKRIKKCTYAVSSSSSFDNLKICTFDEDIMLLKNSDAIRFATYKLKDRKLLDEIYLSEIIDLNYQEISPTRFIISGFDNLFWKYTIEI